MEVDWPQQGTDENNLTQKSKVQNQQNLTKNFRNTLKTSRTVKYTLHLHPVVC